MHDYRLRLFDFSKIFDFKFGPLSPFRRVTRNLGPVDFLNNLNNSLFSYPGRITQNYDLFPIDNPVFETKKDAYYRLYLYMLEYDRSH